MMKNNIIGSLVLGLAITIGGWAVAHENSERILDVVDEQKVDIQDKSTEIANLETVIAEKDNDLKAKEVVIDKQIIQINKQNKEKEKLKEESNSLKVKLQKAENRKLDNAKSQAIKSKEKKKTITVSRGQNKSNGKTIKFVATSYIALCDTGCTGITATGIDVRNYPSKKIIAVDPRVIPLGTKVKVTLSNGESFYATANDTGGDIKGNRIDILMATYNEAVSFGRQNVSVTILN